jgi:hypothetical protein
MRAPRYGARIPRLASPCRVRPERFARTRTINAYQKYVSSVSGALPGVGANSKAQRALGKGASTCKRQQ